MKIIFFHTSPTHIKRFDGLLNKFRNPIEVAHYVNEDLLSFAKTTGKVDEAGFAKAISAINRQKDDVIICTCSTYGELCKEQEKVFRIDQPIGEYLVANFSKIGLAFTVASTKDISFRLLEQLAEKEAKSIQIMEIDCQNCWQWFEKGDIERYEMEIANQIRQFANDMEVVFLAQASMEGAKKYLKNEQYQVVSSPEYGLKTYLELMKAMKG